MVSTNSFRRLRRTATSFCRMLAYVRRVWLVFFFLPHLSFDVAAEEDRPNFVIIMVDDMGYGDAGCFGGSAFATPNIDRLATEGMKFTDFHSSGCVCSPTRAGLLTGRYQQRAGIPGVIYAPFNKNRHHGLQMNEVTFAESLRADGYETAMFGKWHLGYQEQYNPIHQGFDDYVGYVSGNVDFHSHIDGAGVFDWWHKDRLVREKGYTTHLITKHACSFIRNRSGNSPFCLYVAHEAPHDPYQGPNDKPVRQQGQSSLLYNHRELEHATRAYAEMMTEMDKGVGSLLDALRDTGVEKNTLVFFFSDNGATGPGSCGDLYGMKGTLWEGGHRVPAIARWKGKIRPATISNQLASTIDIMPTLTKFAGVEEPKDRPFDGESLARVLINDEELNERQMFWQYGNAVCMRDGKWKLIINGGKPKQPSETRPNINWDRPKDGRHKLALFNLETDVAETRNLATEYSSRVADMKAAINKWQSEVAREATPQPENSQR